MSRQLLILRHAKSDWDAYSQSDFGRPLAKRGKKDAVAMGKWMKSRKLNPDYTVSSPAIRACQTVLCLCDQLKIKESDIQFIDDLYLARLETLLQVLAQCPQDKQRVLLVGHNPGMDDLVLYLSQREPEFTDTGKLMTTAALAIFDMPDAWCAIKAHAAERIELVRPKELKRNN